MKLVQTHDMKILATIMHDPAIWPHIHDDGTPDSWMPQDVPGLYWMAVEDDYGVVNGVFMVHPLNSYCYEMHTCLLPRIWGPQAYEAAQMLLGWAFDGICKKMVTNVPAYNRAALRFAKAGGMKEEGVNRASYMHDGKLVDQIMLGITEGEWLCQQQSH